MTVPTTTAGRLPLDRSVGIGLMILGLALYAFSDAVIKHLLGTYSVTQTCFLRALTRLIPLFLAVLIQGSHKEIFRTDRPGLHAARLGVNLAYTYCFLYAVSMTSLTTIYVLSYVSPVFMIILSALLLKEPIGKGKWIAVTVGLVGVLIAIRPGSSVFEMAAWLVLLGTFLGALNKILMRKLTFTENSLSIAIYPNIAMVAVTLPFLAWQAMPWQDWSLFAVIGTLAAAGQYAIAQALRFTQASTLAPIDYSTLFWVVALDVFFWGNGPDFYVILGALIVAGSDWYMFWRTRAQA